MAKIPLLSGNPDDFQAVGGSGQAVFDSALQIREALRLGKQQAIADCLAIPQISDDGNHVDWYAPMEGKVVSWQAADDIGRQRALRYLESSVNAAAALSHECLQSTKTAWQLFGSLLEKAFQFPDENHVFLLAGKPVITFWGFVNSNESVRQAPLACLQQSLASVARPQSAGQPAPEVTDEPPPPQTAVTTEPAKITGPDKAPSRILRWTLSVTIAIAAAIAAPLLYTIPSSEPPPVTPDEHNHSKVKTILPLPLLTASLPLQQAQLNETPDRDRPEPVTEPVVIAAIAEDVLIMEAEQVRMGVTHFLNGDWRALIDITDPATGKPPLLSYQIHNNKGTARLTRGSNILCRARIFTGLHHTGELKIKSRGHARCSDGSRYPMPEITCKAGARDIARCSARYDSNTVVPLTLRKRNT